MPQNMAGQAPVARPIGPPPPAAACWVLPRGCCPPGNDCRGASCGCSSGSPTAASGQEAQTRRHASTTALQAGTYVMM